MKKGLFITFEGPDGSGKTTQINGAKAFFESKGFDVLLTREPGGNPTAEKIREVILDPRNKGMDPVCEMLLYAAARAEHVANVIEPALSGGKVVISDRYVDSSYAYQGAGRGLGDSVGVINAYATRGIMPDLTVLLLIDPEEGRKRIENRIRKGEEKELDRLEMEKTDFHRRVYEGYKKVAEEEPERIVLMDAEETVEEIARKIRERLERLV